MNKLLLISILCFCFACQNETKNPPTSESTNKDSLETPIPEKQASKIELFKGLEELRMPKDENVTYDSVKKNIEIQRVRLNKEKVNIDSVSHSFKRALVQRIIPFWEGTTWSFEGHTAKPKTGSIACGYFVSTTLRDVGLNLNRYRLAQQSPINEAKSLALTTAIIEIAEGSVEKNIAAIQNRLPEGIHFIGFDQNHVGYILKEKGGLYIIHSNYINAKGVEIEPIKESEVFLSYHNYYLVELSTNKALLNYWLKGKALKIETGK